MNVVLFRSLSDMLYVAREILSTMPWDIFCVFLPQLMAIVCVIANLFLLTNNDIFVHYNKFPNLWACSANFPNPNGRRALPKIAKNP